MNTAYKNNWYEITNESVIDSPALIIYKERVIENIRTALSMIDVNRLRPHVKTNKSTDAVGLMMEAGIIKFKCATIAEAEMLAMKKATDVLLAYQPAGPKLKRFVALFKKYRATKFSCLVDNIPYGLPFHICPTVALYECAVIVEKNRVTGKWKISRDRKISI